MCNMRATAADYIISTVDKTVCVSKTKRALLAARASAPSALPMVAPQPLPLALPKRHGTELDHHARVARDRDSHARARLP